MLFSMNVLRTIGIVSFLAPVSSLAAGRVCNVLDYGAKPDGTTRSTVSIQNAIDECAGGGGGTVRLPAGTYLSGALRLKSRVTILIETGATLLGSRNREDYYGPRLDAQGRERAGSRVFRNLLHGEGLHDIAIRGAGTIDGNGSAFRDKTKRRTKSIYLENCRNVLIEGVSMRNAGCWMQHYRLCEKLTIRGIDVVNHVAFNNDGLNVDSCRDVTITGCRVDSDDDGIVLKSLSDRPCRNVTIRDCIVSSHCNALKMGTESGGGFVDIVISNCRVFSPKHSTKIYGRQRGLAGIALEIVDGGRLQNVSVANVAIDGVSVPIFLRLGNRARPYVPGAIPGVGTFRNVRLNAITATGTSPIGCSITGLPGHPVENVVLTDVSLGFEGGRRRADAGRTIPEKEKSYPESTMFGTLPAYGFFCRHARNLTFENLKLKTSTADLRHTMVFDDIQDMKIQGLEAQCWPGAAPLLRMTHVKRATVQGYTGREAVDTFLRVEGDATEGIRLEKNDFSNVRQVVNRASGVPPGAVSTQ